MMRSHKKNQRGQAIIESGLVMMVVLPVLLGIMDFGQFLYIHQTLSDRTRSAARWGAVNTYANSGVNICNVALYNDSNGSTNGASLILPSLQTSNSTGDGYCSATLANAGTEDATITVTISSYPYTFLLLPSTVNRRTITDTQPYEIGR
jgi:Flp pilus assembly protein TadG